MMFLTSFELTPYVKDSVDILMIFMVITPYISQYREICNLKSCQGFSLYTCFIIILSSILRILFWIMKPFLWALLFQSIVISIVMFILIRKSIQYNTHLGKASTFFDFDRKCFWKWNDFNSYIQCTLVIVIILTFFCITLSDFEIFIQLIGSMAVGIETFLGLPQLYINYKNHSTQGMRFILIDI
ncbi:PQ-loop repeat-containing protein 1 [Intoshia linei]|uniref:PQ-loop repeat-containing protein 1 n=1 Tax=Intoshia linei TaxID=1819745 RepID=A0A177B7N2_9BILA|nr:PQ-loop repeat-containing protein 1 [Intoshia linei]